MRSLLTLSLLAASPLAADEIKLVNGDTLRGSVSSLDAETLVISSESFGELTIPREKVALIGLGESGLPEPAVVTQRGASPGLPAGSLNQIDVGQLMNNPAIQRQFGGLFSEALGGRSVGDLQGDLERSREGLKDLQEDLGGIEGEAIGNYLQMLDVLGGGLNAAPKSPSAPPAQPAQPQPQSTPVERPRATE